MKKQKVAAISRAKLAVSIFGLVSKIENVARLESVAA